MPWFGRLDVYWELSVNFWEFGIGVSLVSDTQFAGKDIGSLPGELGDKIAPYLLPMMENLKYFLTQAYYGLYANEGAIQYKPLELMRGSTFHNSYMILDEAQNCTVEQIKMFIPAGTIGLVMKRFQKGVVFPDSC